MTAMTCERFEAILSDYFEGTLAGEAKAAADSHTRTCKRCARIISDVDRIIRDAAALPPMRPARDLWRGIEPRISAPVISLAPRTHRGVRQFRSAWMAAAAAVLVVGGAGITYFAASRRPAPPPAPRTPTVDSGLTPSTVASAGGETPAGNITPKAQTPSPSVATNDRMKGTKTAATLASNKTATSRTPVRMATASSLGSDQADAAYAHEIEILERMVNSPASVLDPATVQVVKKNLEIIDDAIAQSRAALANDPASPLLYDQMAGAMNKKIELLRTIASLSSST